MVGKNVGREKVGPEVGVSVGLSLGEVEVGFLEGNGVGVMVG